MAKQTWEERTTQIQVETVEVLADLRAQIRKDALDSQARHEEIMNRFKQDSEESRQQHEALMAHLNGKDHG